MEVSEVAQPQDIITQSSNFREIDLQVVRIVC